MCMCMCVCKRVGAPVTSDVAVCLPWARFATTLQPANTPTPQPLWLASLPTVPSDWPSAAAPHCRPLPPLLHTQAEVMELQAPRDVAASGVVVEAQLSKGLGPVATVILKRGMLRPGDPLVVGTEHGRVRVLRSGSGKTLAEAGPGQAVVVSGLKGLPAAGDELVVVQDESRAARMAAARSARAEDFRLSQLTRMQAEARRQQQALREQEYERSVEKAAAAVRGWASVAIQGPGLTVVALPQSPCINVFNGVLGIFVGPMLMC